jgi:hypothetical protein
MDYKKLFSTQLRELSRFYTVSGLKESLAQLQDAEDKLIEMWPKDYADFRTVILSINGAFEGVVNESFDVLIQKNLIEIPKKWKGDKFLSLGKKIGILADSKLFDDDLITLLNQYKNDWRNVSTHETRKYSKPEAIKALAIASMIIVVLIDQTQTIIEKNFFTWIKDLTTATELVHTLVVKKRRNENDGEVLDAIKKTLAVIDLDNLGKALLYLFVTTPEDWQEKVLVSKPKSVLGDDDHFAYFSNNITKMIFRRALLSSEACDWIVKKMVIWRDYALKNETTCKDYSPVKLTQDLDHVRSKDYLRVEHLLSVLVITLFVYGDRLPPFEDEILDGIYPSISKYGQMAGILLGSVGIQML